MDKIKCKSGYYYSNKIFNDYEEAWNTLQELIKLKNNNDEINSNKNTGTVEVNLNPENDEIRYKAPCLEKYGN